MSFQARSRVRWLSLLLAYIVAVQATLGLGARDLLAHGGTDLITSVMCRALAADDHRDPASDLPSDHCKLMCMAAACGSQPTVGGDQAVARLHQPPARLLRYAQAASRTSPALVLRQANARDPPVRV